MFEIVEQAFLDELEKISATRSAIEARKAMAAGDLDTAGEIARRHGSLGLKPRYVQDISLGGQEAGVDLMMGRRAGPYQQAEGLFVRKMYKPDSPITRGDFTTELLKQKQLATQSAREISPEARKMMPAMLGYEQLGSGPTMRHVSYHEYVPGLKDVRAAVPDPVKRYDVIGGVQKTVLDPAKAKGTALGDTVKRVKTPWTTRVQQAVGLKPKSTFETRAINWGNIAMTPSGPKVVDFLPGEGAGGSSTPMSESRRAHKTTDKTRSVFGAAGEGLSPAEEKKRISALRKETFRPQMQVAKPTSLTSKLRTRAGRAVGLAARAL